jgi:hypothetical protein
VEKVKRCHSLTTRYGRSTGGISGSIRLNGKVLGVCGIMEVRAADIKDY